MKSSANIVKISCPSGDYVGAEVTDGEGKGIAGAYRAEITLQVGERTKATIYCHSPSVDVLADATIVKVCPHCKRSEVETNKEAMHRAFTKAYNKFTSRVIWTADPKDVIRELASEILGEPFECEVKT